jgi:hypothetical protein
LIGPDGLLLVGFDFVLSQKFMFYGWGFKTLPLIGLDGLLALPTNARILCLDSL